MAKYLAFLLAFLYTDDEQFAESFLIKECSNVANCLSDWPYFDDLLVYLLSANHTEASERWNYGEDNRSYNHHGSVKHLQLSGYIANWQQNQSLGNNSQSKIVPD